MGSEVAVAGRLHHPGSLMRRGSTGILWGLVHLAAVAG